MVLKHHCPLKKACTNHAFWNPPNSNPQVPSPWYFTQWSEFVNGQGPRFAVQMANWIPFWNVYSLFTSPFPENAATSIADLQPFMEQFIRVDFKLKYGYIIWYNRYRSPPSPISHRYQEPPFFNMVATTFRGTLWHVHSPKLSLECFSHEAESNEGHGGGDEEATQLQRAWLWHLAWGWGGSPWSITWIYEIHGSLT